MIKFFFPSLYLFAFGLPSFWWVMCFVLLPVIFLDLGSFTGVPFSLLFASIDSVSSMLVPLSVWVIMARYFSSSGSGWFGSVVSSGAYSLVLFFLGVVLVLSLRASDVVMFYVSFEAPLIPIFLIVLGRGYQPERLQAGLYMIMYTLFGSIPLSFSLMYFSSSVGSSGFLSSGLLVLYGGLFSGRFVLFLSSAFLIKTPIYFFHLWLPKAHVEAPTGGSMVPAGVLLKLGSYGLIRFSCFISSFLVGGWFWLVVVVSVGGLFGGLVALFQSDAKSLVAYSSVSHIGLLTGGIPSGSYIGLMGGFIVVLCHGPVSSLLSHRVGLVYGFSGGRTFSSLFGLLFLPPFFGYMVFVALAANFSVPPFVSLLGELGLLAFYGSMGIGLFLVFGVLSYSCAVFCFYLSSSVFMGGVYSSGFSGSSFRSVSGYFCGLVIHLFPFLLYLFSVNSAFSCFQPVVVQVSIGGCGSPGAFASGSRSGCRNCFSFSPSICSLVCRVGFSGPSFFRVNFVFGFVCVGGSVYRSKFCVRFC